MVSCSTTKPPKIDTYKLRMTRKRNSHHAWLDMSSLASEHGVSFEVVEFAVKSFTRCPPPGRPSGTRKPSLESSAYRRLQLRQGSCSKLRNGGTSAGKGESQARGFSECAPAESTGVLTGGCVRGTTLYYP